MNEMKKLFILFLIFGVVFSVSTSVVIYPSSVSIVSKEYTKSFTNGPFEIVFDDLSLSALSSLHAFMHSGTITGLSLKTVEYEVEEQADLYDLLNASIGKDVTIVTSAPITGKLKWFGEGFLVITSNSLTSFYNLNDIMSFSLPVDSYTKKIIKEKPALVMKGTHPTGSDTVTLKYFQSGLDWDIYYSLVTKGTQKGTAELQASAIITNSAEDYKDVELTLVAGLPNFVSYYYSYAYDYYSETKATSEASATDGGSFVTSTSATGFWLYKLKDKIDLKKYEENSYVMFTSNVPYEYKYIWDVENYYYGGTGTVQKKYFFNNTDKFTWPSGTVRVFEDTEFAGEDSIDYTPKKEQVELLVSTVPEIVVSQEELSSTTNDAYSYEDITYTISKKLTMKNAKEEKITLYVNADYSGYSNFELVESSLDPTIDGQKLQWVVELDPDEELEITYTYEYGY